MHYIKTVQIQCVIFKKYTENKNTNVRKNKQNRLMPLLNCAICGKKNHLL